MSRTTGCGRKRLARLVAMVLIALYGRVNALRSEGEETIPLRRYRELGCEWAQSGRLGGAMVVVFGLGAAGMAMVTRRRRSDYDAGL